MSRPRTRRALHGGLALMALSVALGGAADSAKADDTEISFQPRVWYNWHSDSQTSHNIRDAGNDINFQTASTAYELPFYGGTVTVKNPAVFGAGTLAVTVLNGDAQNHVNGVMYYNKNTPKSAYFQSDGTDEEHRFDAEALFILPIRSTTQVYAGARYIGFDWKRNMTAINGSPPAGGTYSWDESSNAFYAELGFGLSAPLSENGRHILFANLTGLIGIDSNNFTVDPSYRKQWSGGVDANVGYAYQMTDALKLSARYRIFARSQLEHWSSQGSDLMHGPEVGLTYTFGRNHESLK